MVIFHSKMCVYQRVASKIMAFYDGTPFAPRDCESSQRRHGGHIFDSAVNHVESMESMFKTWDLFFLLFPLKI